MRSAKPSSCVGPNRLAALAATVLAAVAVAGLPGCGDEDTSSAPAGDVVDISGTEPVGEKLAGSVAPLVQCRDWTGATEDEKLATIADIRSQVNLTDTGVDAPPLSDDEAMSVFNNACAEDFADGFRLYVLYARAAGFAPLTREEP